jgi:hypothetical protein
MVKKSNGRGPYGSQIVAASTGVGKAWQISISPVASCSAELWASVPGADVVKLLCLGPLSYLSL